MQARWVVDARGSTSTRDFGTSARPSVVRVLQLQHKRIETATRAAVQRERRAHAHSRQKIASTLRTVMTARQAEDLFAEGVAAIKELVGAERATLFMFDAAKAEMWSRVGDFDKEIRLPVGKGIAGHVAATGVGVNIADAYKYVGSWCRVGVVGAAVVNTRRVASTVRRSPHVRIMAHLTGRAPPPSPRTQARAV